jgi:cellulose biosynthesis protein BcsQ
MTIALSAPPAVKRTRGLAVVLSIIAAKGGVGKTLIASSLGCGFALAGLKVLIGEIEDNMRLYHVLTGAGRRGEPPLDQNLTTYAWFTSPRQGMGDSAYKVHLADLAIRVPSLGKGALRELLIRRAWTMPQTLEFVPGSERLRGLENQYAMATQSAHDPNFIPYGQLARAMEAISPDYDVVILDTPPALSLVQQNVLLASDYVIPVIDFDIDSIADYDRTIAFYKTIAASAPRVQRQPPRVLGVVYNKYDASFTENDVPLLEAYTAKHFDPFDPESDRLIEPLVPYDNLGVIPEDRRRLTAAMNARQTVHTFAPTSPIGEALYQLCQATQMRIPQLAMVP